MLMTTLLRLTGLLVSMTHFFMDLMMTALLLITVLLARLFRLASVLLVLSWRSPYSVRGGSMRVTTLSMLAIRFSCLVVRLL